MRWYVAGSVFALAGIACTVIGDRAVKREVSAEVWDEASSKSEKTDDGVHGLSGE